MGRSDEAILELFADNIKYTNKETFSIIYELLTEEVKNPYHALEYLIIKSIDAKLAKMVIGKTDSVLNVGCGFPLNELMFKSWGVNKVVGIDADRNVIEKGKGWLKNLNISGIDLHAGDALNLDYPDNSFDVVVSFSAIEHVQGWQNYEKWIESMSRIAKRNIVLTTSNKKNWIIYSLSKLVPHSYYEYFFTPKQIERLLLEHNLKIAHFETNTLMCNEYIPLLPTKFRYNGYTLKFNLFLERLRGSFFKNGGGEWDLLVRKFKV